MTITKRILSLFLSICLCLSVFAPCALAEESAEYATREYIISEFVQSVGRATLGKSDAVLGVFGDAEKISPEYKDDISRAIVGGILKGYDDRTIRPGEWVSRIEAMVMLARCVPNLEQTEEAIAFTDVPEWAKADIEYLSKAGLVKGYGDGTMGAEDYITVEQVGLLVERSDEALNTLAPGDSFYGYVNEKTFRNAVLEDSTTIDYIHGAVVSSNNAWSNFNDIYSQIIDDEEEILTKIVNGEVEVEKGSAEQRVRDMLECVASGQQINDTDKENIIKMREAILNANSLEEFLDVTADIYKLAGINVAFDISIALDKETGVPYPIFSVDNVGWGGVLGFREKTNTAEHKDLYAELLLRYFEAIGVEFEKKDILSAIELQDAASKDADIYSYVLAFLTAGKLFGTMTDEDIAAEVSEMMRQHPERFNTETGEYISAKTMYDSEDREVADAAYTGFDLCEELSGYGFTNLEKIIICTEDVAKAEKNIIAEENLTALKINALIKLGDMLGVRLTNKEDKVSEMIGLFPLMISVTSSVEDLKQDLIRTLETVDEEDVEQVFQDATGVEYKDGILNAANLEKIRELLPNDIGLIYAKHYYDNEISYVIAQMLTDIADAYQKRFEANTWMDEETKANAIKKLDKMIAVVGYPDNYTFPEITPMSEGGTLLSNTLSVRRHAVNDIIRCNDEKEFLRTQMLMPPDEVNACYLLELNTINVPAGILNPPIYDPNASYEANLGSIGMVLAHEIGHAFDKMGAQHDENGCFKNWWTENDAADFAEIQEKFVEYYNNFEVVDGVVQDANVTITENMADFAAMQVIMDIIGDDKEAQKECFESYAKMWAKVGTVSYLTSDRYMSDVHSANVVRINAVVASFDQFYDIYDIDEEDNMYVAPEERLKLW